MVELKGYYGKIKVNGTLPFAEEYRWTSQKFKRFSDAVRWTDEKIMEARAKGLTAIFDGIYGSEEVV